MLMDAKWVEAVEKDDVEFFRNTVHEYKRQLEAELEANQGQSDYQYDYSTSCFLSQHRVEDKDLGNILHLAAWKGQKEIFAELVISLPDQLVHLLLIQQDWARKNPLHVAAQHDCQLIVKLIMGFYENFNLKYEVVKLETKPWLAKDAYNMTPVHTALCESYEENALEMLTAPSVNNENYKDLNELCNIVNDNGKTLLSLAVANEFSRVALHILRFAPSYNLGDKKVDILFYGRHCSEEVFKLLLVKHPDLIKEVDNHGHTVVRLWLIRDDFWPLEIIMKSVNEFPELKRHLEYLCADCSYGYVVYLFHLFASHRMLEASTNLAHIYRELRAKELASFEGEANQLRQLPWLVTDMHGISALEMAITDNKTASDEYKRLKSDLFVMESAVEGKCELLFVAINKGLNHVAEAIWYVQQTYGWCEYPAQGRELWNMALKFSEEAAIWVAQKLPSLTSDHDEVKYVLRSAAEAGATRFIEWMLKNDPSGLELEPTIWVEACKRGHFSTVMAFINHCPHFREICIELRDTPLHHIKFKGYRQYLDFLKDPIVLALKNFRDRNGKTPLHKSIESRNLLLTEVLLTTDDVIRSIEDNDRNTAMDLLVKACRKSWKWNEMCKRNGIIPELKTTYFQDKTNLLEVRNTLSVVAALLATITFTAGFTLPGGVQSDNSGKPTLGNKAAFLVFLLADTLAMCCSMLVLVSLLWSMLCDHNRSLLLIDKSMPMLLVALYSTLVAFMTGVYVVIPHKSLWSAIVVLGMCSIFIVLSKRWIMYKLLDRLNPVMDRNNGDEEMNEEIRLMEEGEGTTLQDDRSSWIQERASSSTRGSYFQKHFNLNKIHSMLFV